MGKKRRIIANHRRGTMGQKYQNHPIARRLAQKEESDAAIPSAAPTPAPVVEQHAAAPAKAEAKPPAPVKTAAPPLTADKPAPKASSSRKTTRKKATKAKTTT